MADPQTSSAITAMTKAALLGEIEALREVIRDLVDEVTIYHGDSWNGPYTDHGIVIGPFSVDVSATQAAAVQRALDDGRTVHEAVCTMLVDGSGCDCGADSSRTETS